MVTVITSISERSGGGWSAYGECFPSDSFSCKIDDWHGETQETLYDLLPSCYILKSVWDSLDDNTKESAYSRVIDIVDSNYGISGVGYSNGRRYCTRDFNTNSIIYKYITSGIYATSFSTRTRDGETYYWVYGWRLGRQVYRESATDFDGSSKDPLETIGWCDYISESAYNTLSVVMREAFDASSHKVAKDGALTKIPSGDPGYFRFGLVSDMVYDVPIGICEGVVCDDICIGMDKYSQKCITGGVDAGTCVFDQLIEENSPDCGYVQPDPCEGVICNPICVGTDKWYQSCVNGECVKDALIEPNSPDCGYVPPPDDKDDLLETIGISKEHATAAILIIIAIIILRRLL